METKEPSMEEILSSIRRILSHEESAMSADESLKSSVSADAFAHEQKPTSDVMELTSDMLLDNIDAKKAPLASSVSTVPDDMVLLSEEAMQASADKLNAFARQLSPSVKEDKKPESDALEELVGRLLKPYLKEWLDAHLPSMVEQIVQREVQRLVDKVHLS